MIFVVEDCRVSVWSLSPLTESAESPGDLDEGDVVIKLYSITNKHAVHLGNACFTKYGFGFIDVADEEYLSKC